MLLVTSPLQPPSDSQWPVRRAIVLWLAASAAFWLPIAIGAYWLLRHS
jgi:hypothetical protein